MRRGEKDMADCAELREELEQANRHISETQGRIAHQRHLVGQLSTEDDDAKDAANLLWTLEESLGALQRHREQIRHELSQAEAEAAKHLAPPPCAMTRERLATL
jgi:hypothetical protein